MSKEENVSNYLISLNFEVQLPKGSTDEDIVTKALDHLMGDFLEDDFTLEVYSEETGSSSSTGIQA